MQAGVERLGPFRWPSFCAIAVLAGFPLSCAAFFLLGHVEACDCFRVSFYAHFPAKGIRLANAGEQGFSKWRACRKAAQSAGIAALIRLRFAQTDSRRWTRAWLPGDNKALTF